MKRTNPKTSTPAERLKYTRKLMRLPRSYIEEKHKLPEATLKAWENGVSRLTEKGLKKCIDIYRKEGIIVSEKWVMSGVGLSPQLTLDVGRYFASELQYPQRKAKKGQVKEIDKEAVYAKDDNACMLREATFFKESYSDSVILMITDNDMEPVYQIGDHVGGRFRYGKQINSALKRDCIIRLKNGENILRRLFKAKKTGCYNLASINPLPISGEPVLFDVEIESAAPVIWHRKPDI